MKPKHILGIAAIATAALVAAFAWTGAAFAHVDIASSNPEAGTTLATSPAAVTVTFDGEIQKAGGTYSLAVTNAGGTSVTSGAASVSADGTQLSVPLQASLPDGTYTVAWSNTSAEDGDSESGEFSFYVSAGGDMPAMPDTGGNVDSGHSHDDGGHDEDAAAFDPPTTGLIVIRLHTLNDSGVSGRAELFPVDGGARTRVNVFLNGVQPNSSHMSHIHVNTNCAAEPGSHAADLANVVAGETTTGRSENVIDVPFSVVANGGHSIFSHAGADPSGDKTPIACGAIPAQPEGAGHGHDDGVTLPSAGTGSSRSTALPMDLPALLVFIGTLLIAGGLVQRSLATARAKS